MSYNQYPPIFQKAYILTVEMYKIVGSFCRSYKFSLGEKLINISEDILKNIIETNAMIDKAESIKLLDKKLEWLKINIRIAFDLNAISAGQLEHINRIIFEIGRQIGGWRKYAVKMKQNTN